jgi:DNA polymerase-3 subunit alpha
MSHLSFESWKKIAFDLFEGQAALTPSSRGQEQAALHLLGHLKEIFPERLYVELQIHDAEDEALASKSLDLSQDLQLQSVATHDIHYLTPQQAHLQRVLTAIRLNQPIAQIPPQAAAPPNASFTSQGEMAALFQAHPSALARTEEIAERCQLELPLGSPLFPEIPLPPNQTALEVLRREAEAGAYDLYVKPHAAQLPPEVHARLDHELAVIEHAAARHVSDR